MPIVRILHLSDLHEGKPGPETLWRKRRVLGDSWLRNLETIHQDAHPIDLICLTGDLAYSGKGEHYKEAAAFIETILQKLHVARDRLFLVPGNHDVNRESNKATWKRLRKQLTPDDAATLSGWLTGGQPLRGFTAGQLNGVLDRRSEFYQWLNRPDSLGGLGRPELSPERSSHGRLGYRQTLMLADRPFPIQVIGLDTGWLCGDDGDAGKLWLTDGQVLKLTADNQAQPLHGLRLVLMHHPLTDLMDGAHCRRLLAERVDLVLRGHLHKPETSLWQDPQRDLREAAAGCLYESDRYPNSCQILDIHTDNTGRPWRYVVWFRTWSAHGHWFNDDSLYQGSRLGRISLTLKPSPPDGHPPLNPRRVFVGRTKEMASLEQGLLPTGEAVQPAAVCALQGMPGVGKSFLAEEFVHRHRNHFPGGIDAWPFGRTITARRPPCVWN